MRHIVMVALGQRGDWDYWPSRLELEAKGDVQMLALQEGMEEDWPKSSFLYDKE